MFVYDPNDITIIFPEGLSKPTAKIKCRGCNTMVISEVTWEDAIIFDSAGANVVGYSFVRGNPITNDEIEKFMDNFDEEINRFLDICSK